jgi:hypothetical protein
MPSRCQKLIAVMMCIVMALAPTACNVEKVPGSYLIVLRCDDSLEQFNRLGSATEFLVILGLPTPVRGRMDMCIYDDANNDGAPQSEEVFVRQSFETSESRVVTFAGVLGTKHQKPRYSIETSTPGGPHLRFDGMAIGL